MRKPVFEVSTRSDTNRAVQSKDDGLRLEILSSGSGGILLSIYGKQRRVTAQLIVPRS